MAKESEGSANAQLGEFVAEALVQIVEAIRDANVRAATSSFPRLWKELDEPRLIGTPEDQPVAFALAYGESQEKGAGIHFDIAVSAESTRGASGGAKFAIGVVGVGGDGSATTQRSHVSRVQFSVQVKDDVPQSKVSEPDPDLDPGPTD